MPEPELIGWAVVTRHANNEFQFRARGSGNSPVVMTRAQADDMALELVGYSRETLTRKSASSRYMRTPT